jgi:cobaltochelatase CobN
MSVRARHGDATAVVLPDGRRVKVAPVRGHLFVCATGCCCGREDKGLPAVPTTAFHEEWERRGLRGRVHLTIGGCLGPCALANVVLLVFDGRAHWFHSVDAVALVHRIYDHVERMLAAGRALAPPRPLRRHEFRGWTWQQPGAGVAPARRTRVSAR